MFKENVKKLVKFFKEKWVNWILYLIKRYFIAYISYFLYTTTVKLEFVKYIFDAISRLYGNSEKLHLTYYVSILFAIEAIVYFLLGVLVESFIRKWIEKRMHKANQENVFRDISFGLKRFLKLIVVKFKFVRIESLENIKLSDKDSVSLEDRNILWKDIIVFIKHVLGFLVLASITALIEWNSLFTYWFVGIGFTLIIVFCLVVLVTFYVFIENINEVFVLVESYAQTIVRHDKKSNQ